MQEPKIHSRITGDLPENDPRAGGSISCERCHAVLHCCNECMQTWVETGKGNYCLTCFVNVTDGGSVLEDEFGLLEKEPSTAD